VRQALPAPLGLAASQVVQAALATSSSGKNTQAEGDMTDDIMKAAIGTAFAILQTVIPVAIAGAIKLFWDVKSLKKDMNQAFKMIREIKDELRESYHVRFATRQLVKFGKETNWDKVKADYDIRIRDLIPGGWLDDEAVKDANAALDAIALACIASDDVSSVLEAGAAGDWAGATAALKSLVARVSTSKVLPTLLAV